MRELYGRGYGRDDVLKLFRFMDYVLMLPAELSRRFDSELEKLEEQLKMNVRQTVVLLLAATTLCAGTASASFDVRFSEHGIVSLKRVGDARNVEFVRPNNVVGDLVVRYRAGDETWQTLATASLDNQVTQSSEGRSLDIVYAPDGPLGVSEQFNIRDDELTWAILLQNKGSLPVEIGDLALPLPMFTDYTWNKEETFETRLYRHQFISGDGSFLFWQPVGGRGPHLVMLPEPGTAWEYFSEQASDYAHGGGRFSRFPATSGWKAAGRSQVGCTGPTPSAISTRNTSSRSSTRSKWRGRPSRQRICAASGRRR